MLFRRVRSPSEGGQAMMIGERLKAIRTTKNLSQGVIEARTGLLRCYISRVENGHTTPSVETLERLARGLEIPMYQLFYDGEGPPTIPPSLVNGQIREKKDWASRGKGLQQFMMIRQLVSRMNERDRNLMLQVARQLNGRRNK
jgi:transcriptional regulator with XRE-family HTH domain